MTAIEIHEQQHNNGFSAGQLFAQSQPSIDNEMFSRIDEAVGESPATFAGGGGYTAAQRLMFICFPECDGKPNAAADAWTAILGDDDFGGSPPDAFVRGFIEGVVSQWR